MRNEFRRIVRQAIDAERIDDPLRKFLTEIPEVGFETPNHHRIEFAGPHWDAACETLRVEDFKQAGEGVGVAVVRRRRQEEPVLKTLGKPTHRAGELAVNRVT